MITRTYQKLCDAGRLQLEIIESGKPVDPSPGARFYGISVNYASGGQAETNIFLYDDITQQEITEIDAIVAAHIPTPLPPPTPAPTDGDGKPYVRNEVRPLGLGAYFSSAGDDPTLGIGKGTRIDWNFADSEMTYTTLQNGDKQKIFDLQFNEEVCIRGGYLVYMNSIDECMIDMGVVCPAGQYYYNSHGVPTLATTDVWISRYVNQFDMDGNNSGIYIDGGTASDQIPVNYKLRFQVTTEPDDVQSRGHVAMMLYRRHTVTLPS